MRRSFTVAAVTVLLGTGAAWAQAPAQQSSSDSEYTDTLYTSDQHMGYSIRVTMLRWLGGVPVARDRDVRASTKENWWGEPVAELKQPLPQSDR